MTDTIAKMKNSSRSMAVLFKVLQTILYVGMGITLCSAIFLTLFPNGSASWLSIRVYSGLSFNGQALTLAQLPIMTSVLCWMVLLQIMFYQARDVFQDIYTSGTPFTPVNVRRIRTIAIVLLIGSVLPGLLQYIASLFAQVPAGEFVNGIALTVGLVLLCLARMFAYGVQIQQENDQLL
ncbi:MAG: DUF2975 domain-containing protein [Eubacteriales bacterium]|nr:DUF2975 domain-containing protein [Eubacteriales bacterium]